MTNREYLATLSDRKLAEIIIEELPIVWKGYSNSIIGLAEWFSKERDTGCLNIGDGYLETTFKSATWVLSADGFHCSRCSYKNQSSGFPGTCPNCGSKMKGVDDVIAWMPLPQQWKGDNNEQIH